MTTTFQFNSTGVAWDVFFKSTPEDNDGSWDGADFIFQWWVFSLSAGGPLCSILHHCKTSVQVANRSAELSWFTMEWQKRPHYQGHFSFCSCTQNIFFKSILSTTEGIPGWMQQYPCCSPKINNAPTYTTHLSFMLWIWMEIMANAALPLRRQPQSSDRAYH